MVPLLEEPKLIEWTTEILQCKLWSALTLGESLSSLQIRINDQMLAQEIEQQLSEADVIEDPLLRTLYSGIFGAFQKSQLQRILGKSRQSEILQSESLKNQISCSQFSE